MLLIDGFTHFAYLNSSFGAFLSELYGRSYGGGVLELAAYELRRFPVIDPSKLSEHQRDTLSEKFTEVEEAVSERLRWEQKIDSMSSRSKMSPSIFEKEMQSKMREAVDKEQRARADMDSVIYDTLGFSPKQIRQIEDGLAELQEIRRLRTQV